jgi:predicted heme/steroid binding protein
MFMGDELKKFALNELKQYDGREGRPAHVAYNGKVYDVSESFLWMEGDHQGQHVAGNDLTDDMKSAPHGEEMLERVRLVGVLASGSEEKEG